MPELYMKASSFIGKNYKLTIELYINTLNHIANSLAFFFYQLPSIHIHYLTFKKINVYRNSQNLLNKIINIYTMKKLAILARSIKLF